MLISAGRRDPIIPLENVQRLAALLKKAGGDVSLEIQEGGHGLVRKDVAVAKAWLEQ